MTDILRQQLGSELHRLRKAARVQVPRAALTIGKSKATFYRIEAGEAPLGARDVKRLARLYRADAATVERLAALAESTTHLDGGWWDAYGGAPSPWFANYLAAEERACEVAMWSATVVPGLLQTPEYAAAVIDDIDPEEKRRRVDIRMRRQKIFCRPNPAKVSVILGQAALCQRVGGEPVMREQMRRLLEVGALPNVSIRVIPFVAGPHPALVAGPIIVLDEGTSAGLVYLESAFTAAYGSTPDIVDQHARLLGDLAGRAIPEEQSRLMIAATGGWPAPDDAAQDRPFREDW
jgi:hypothetical protein